jgi:hypothetical protein
MSILSEVQDKLAELRDHHLGQLADPLAEAERLSDLFADVRPQPYIVPIERYAGLPVYGEAKSVIR